VGASPLVIVKCVDFPTMVGDGSPIFAIATKAVTARHVLACHCDNEHTIHVTLTALMTGDTETAGDGFVARW